ncbi:MAG: twin-arginine translocation signal domain-containing protein [Motiliproteus sp.]
MSKEKLEGRTDPGRREFLKTLTVAGGAVAVVVAAGQAGAATEQITEKQETRSQGYRETDHVREYYKSARI